MNVFWIYFAGTALGLVCLYFGYRTKDDGAPKPSGAHGTADIASPEMLAAAGLIGGKPGEGLRLCEDGYGHVIRYKGPGGKGQPNSVAIIGPPRSGKGNLAMALTVENQGSMFIIDPRGEIFAVTQRTRRKLGPVKVICPFTEDLPEKIVRLVGETDSYNILDDLNPQSESFEMACDTVAQTLIASDGKESQNSGYFSGNARRAAAGVIMQLKLYYPQEANLARVCEILSTEEIFEFARDVETIGNNKYVQTRLSMFAAKDAEKSSGIRDFLKTVGEQLGFMSGRAMERVLKTPKTPWRLRDLKQGEKPMTVYVIIPAKFAASASRFNRMLIGALGDELITTPPGRHHVTVLADEFPLMGRIPIFETMFSMGGGSGVSMVPMAQNVGQMTDIWGDNGWRTLRSCCDLVLYFPPKDPKTAAEISEIAGRRTIVTKNYSFDPNTGEWGNVGYGETGQPVMDTHDAPAQKGRCFVYAPGLARDVVLGETRFYRDYPDIAPLCDENPWHKSSDVLQMPARP